MHPRRLALYSEVDKRTSEFMVATGLRCPTGCGHCCTDHHPHVTVADVTPIVQALIASGQAEAVLEQATATVDGPCVLYRAEVGCTQYAARPMTCRLFGFAAVHDKRGVPQLALCHVHRREQPELAAAALLAVVAGLPVPHFDVLQDEADALDPQQSLRQLPINQALVSALERELLHAQFAACADVILPESA